MSINENTVSHPFIIALGAVCRGNALQVERSRVRYPIVSLEHFLDIIRCVGLTNLPHSCANCLVIWKPQPTETLWACNRHVTGIILLLPLLQ